MSLQKRYVLSQGSVQHPLPLTGLGVIWLLLDRFTAPEWAFVFFWCVAVFTAIGWFLDYRRNVPVTFHDMVK